jgi:hypothetical protein
MSNEHSNSPCEYGGPHHPITPRAPLIGVLAKPAACRCQKTPYSKRCARYALLDSQGLGHRLIHNGVPIGRTFATRVLKVATSVLGQLLTADRGNEEYPVVLVSTVYRSLIE